MVQLQLDALRRAGCEKTFTEKASGAKADRPELARVLHDLLRRGEVLVVWKLDRLARSPKKLITTAEDLEERGIGLVSLTGESTPRHPGAYWCPRAGPAEIGAALRGRLNPYGARGHDGALRRDRRRARDPDHQQEGAPPLNGVRDPPAD